MMPSSNTLAEDVSSVPVLEAGVDPERYRGAGSSASHVRGDEASVAQRDPARAGAGTGALLAPQHHPGGGSRINTVGRAWIGGDGYPVVIEENADEQQPWLLRAAIWAAVAVLEAKGPWVSLARQYVMTNGPGDCLYLPPAWLLDLDEHHRSAARRWRLMRGRLVHAESGHGFDHVWLEAGDVVVSVSNLRLGYPIYAMRRGTYYTRNRVQGVPVAVSTRRLRAAARRLGIGPGLARWLMTAEAGR